MPIQDVVVSYTTKNPLGFPGMIAESQMIKDVASKVVVTTATIPFGVAVGAGASDGSVRLGGTGAYQGITVADLSRTADQYVLGEVAGVIRKGTVWVTASVAVVPSDTVYYVPATGVITNVSTGNTAIPGAKFETTAAAGALVRVYLG